MHTRFAAQLLGSSHAVSARDRALAAARAHGRSASRAAAAALAAAREGRAWVEERRSAAAERCRRVVEAAEALKVCVCGSLGGL